MTGPRGLRLVLLGPPGAGKGTQAARLAARLHVPHIATGDILRRHRQEGTPLGREAEQYMARGELVPDAVMIRMVGERLAAPDCAGGFILDGFPRTIPQAEALDQVLARAGRPLNRVVQLLVPREELLARFLGRRLCPSCGAVYHVTISPPRVEGRCDRCGAQLIRREDDDEETVRRRLSVYEEQTAPLVGYYRERGLLRSADGTGAVEDVTVRILEALD